MKNFLPIFPPVLFFIFFFPGLLSQEITFTGKEWEDPSLFEINQVAPHALIPGLYGGNGQTNGTDVVDDFFISLNGTWKFNWYERPELAPDNFPDPEYNCNKWNDICVPSNWQMMGYGHPKFRNIALTFESDPPRIPDYYNPTGCYKRTFKVPSDWIGKEIFLRFEGVKSAAYIWINGEAVGYNQGGFEPAEFNITNYVSKGKNEVSVKVLRFSDGSYLENQDMWRLSGIFREVSIYALPKVHIHDFFHYTDLDDACINADLYVDVDVVNSKADRVENYSLQVDVRDKSGNSVFEGSPPEKRFSAEPGMLVSASLKAAVISPALWSAEFPNLYEISYSLKDQNGNLIHSFSKKIGFREIEIKGEVFLLNGVSVKLNGVNSHMHHPRYGQSVPVSTLKKDLMLMKQHNINAVRTSHYPPSPQYLDLADEIGMYIIDEVGDEAHGNIHLSYDPSYTEMYRDRSEKLVYRDRNHASVIIWSAGNESGSGPNIDAVIQTGKSIDPTRPGWMYGGNKFYIPFEDITGPRYWIPFQLKNLAEGKILDENDLRPAFMDEYLAATGNGLGGMDEYWELIRKYPRILGGAIWDWVSPGIHTPLRIIPDNSINGNHGAIMGRPQFTNGKTGRAIALSGHDDWIEFYRSDDLDIRGNQLAISCWIKPSKIPQTNNILMKGNHQFGLLITPDDKLEFYVQSNNVNDTLQSPYFTNQSTRHAVNHSVSPDWYEKWHHLAAVYDGNEMKLYVDTLLVATASNTENIASSPFPLCIGRDAETQDQGEHSGRLSSFVLDEFMLFDKAFDIIDLYHGLHKDKSLVAMDFESEIEEGEFLATGLGGRTYGLIWPDREIQPELKQVKKSGQPVFIELIDPVKGLIHVTNHHHFMNLSAYHMQWSLLNSGVPSDSGVMKIELDPGESADINIPYPRLKSSGEIILEVSFRLKEDTKWAKKGFETAWEQFILQEPLTEPIFSADGRLELSETPAQLIINGNDFEYVISKRNGLFTSFSCKQANYIESGPLFNVWRAPLANDTDPWGSFQYSDKKKTEGLGRSIDNQLRSLGMRDLVLNLEDIHIYQPDAGTIEIKMKKYYNAHNLRGTFICQETYTFYSGGEVEIHINVTPQGIMPDMLPKLGYQFFMPKDLNLIEWYGRGPFETYPDRMSGAKTGIHTSDINREYVPYIIPQDHGNHTDVRWLELKDDSGRKIEFTGNNLFNFSYHKYGTDNLSRACYTYQLEENTHNTLNIDFQVSGVGGTAVRQLEKYRVKPGECNFSFTIKPD
ncbi:MAG: DUF4981 domain-containing protein [Bacteroidales bacterium]|nr:DUF4981 domain-containing protein [Bacteroidales bacterium]